MTDSLPPSPRQRWYRWTAIGATLVGIAGAVLWGRWQLGRQMQDQIVGRDAMILQALAQQEQRAPGPELEGLDPREPVYQLGTMLRMASLTNIIASRLFTPAGQFLASVPDHVSQATLDSGTLARLHRGEAVGRFLPALSLADLFLLLPEPGLTPPPAIACVEISVPLLDPDGSTNVIGIAQFLLEGLTARRAFALLDQRLNRQTLIIFGAVALLASVSIAWAFRKLEHANRLLATRSTELQRANRELAEAAKVAAVGAVAAHLIHSLRNPVAGLQSFVVARQEQAALNGDQDWREALAATRRMQALIQQVVDVLREQETGPAYALTPRELGAAALAQARTLADRQGVRLALELDAPDLPLDNRTAGIVRLILSNLFQNGIQASTEGTVVTLRITWAAPQLCFEVADHGSGIPDALRPRLFQPMRSPKEGGSGIGLAISRQLATHLGAELRLAHTSARGTAFILSLPTSERLT